jgi:hypothetical protein
MLSQSELTLLASLARREASKAVKSLTKARSFDDQPDEEFGEHIRRITIRRDQCNAVADKLERMLEDNTPKEN